MLHCTIDTLDHVPMEVMYVSISESNSQEMKLFSENSPNSFDPPYPDMAYKLSKDDLTNHEPIFNFV